MSPVRTPKTRLFTDQPLTARGNVELGKEQTHYLCHVMRKRIDDALLLFNSHDGEWLGKITSVSKKSCVIDLVEQTQPQRKEPDLWLCFAPVKNAPVNNLVQKATELGVSVLQPVFTQHTITRKVNLERMRSNVIEAAEQSCRLTVPQVNEPVTLDQLLQEWDASRRLIVCDESGNGTPATKALLCLAKGPAAIIIGPEGGFSSDEFSRFRKESFVTSIGMGPRILRADTAAIAALTCFQSTLGDWDEQPDFAPH